MWIIDGCRWGWGGCVCRRLLYQGRVGFSFLRLFWGWLVCGRALKSGALVGSHMSSNFSQIKFAPPAFSLKWQRENIWLRLFQAQSALSGDSQGGGVGINIIPPSFKRSIIHRQLNHIAYLFCFLFSFKKVVWLQKRLSVLPPENKQLGQDNFSLFSKFSKIWTSWIVFNWSKSHLLLY